MDFGVKTSSGATAISSPTSSSGKDVKHSRTDNVGNSVDLSGNFKVRYNSRAKVCGVAVYKFCRTSACGVDLYKECWHY